MGRRARTASDEAAVRNFVREYLPRIGDGKVLEIADGPPLALREQDWLVATYEPQAGTDVILSHTESPVYRLEDAAGMTYGSQAAIILNNVLDTILAPSSLVSQMVGFLNPRGILLLSLTPREEPLIEIYPHGLEIIFQQAGLHTYDMRVNPDTGQLLAWAMHPRQVTVESEPEIYIPDFVEVEPEEDPL